MDRNAAADGAGPAPAASVRIAVFCGSSRRVAPIYFEAARTLGRTLAERGHVLVYGGGRTGLMGAVADAALAARGVVHGVILEEFIEQDVHHRSLDELVRVGDMRSRKAGLDERSDAFIALPGGLGTLEELSEILSFRKLGLHHRPLVLLDIDDFYHGLVEQIRRAVADAFDREEALAYFEVLRDPVAAIDACEAATGLRG